MTYAGTETVYVDNQNPAMIRLETLDLDADTEAGAAIELSKYFKAGQEMPRRFTTLISANTAGATVTTIAVELEGSVDGTTWTAINSAVLKATNYPHDATKNDQLWRYVRHYATTVGAGNNLDAMTLIGV